MSRPARRATSLVEILFAVAILATALLGAYTLLSNEFAGFRRLDRRQVAESISLNIQDRYARTRPDELTVRFGKPDGSEQTLAKDPVLLESLPHSPSKLKQMGFSMKVYAASLDHADGEKAAYFTSEVSWQENGARRSVTHSRVISGGFESPDATSASGTTGATGAAATGTAEAMVSGAKPARELLPLEMATNHDLYGERATAVEYALAGQGANAPIAFDGPQDVFDQLSRVGEGPSISGTDGLTGGAQSASAVTTAAGPEIRLANGGPLRGPDGGGAVSAGDVLDMASRGLTPTDQRRLIPGAQPTSAELLQEWGPLEQRKVPPGFYRYTSQEFYQLVAKDTLCFEVFSLVPLERDTEHLTMLGRRRYLQRELKASYLEGEEVLERCTYQVKAAGPGQPPAPAGTEAVLERCPTRLYVHRPVFLPSGIPAPFGREIAILEWDSPERDPVEGPSGRKAREEIVRLWMLTARQAARKPEAPASGSAMAQGSHRDRIPIGLMSGSLVSSVAATWNRKTGRHAAAASDATVATADKDYAAAVASVNGGKYAEALEQVERALGRFPGAVELLRFKAAILTQLERWEDASAAYQELASRGDASVSTFNNLAFVEIHRGDYRAALTAARAALEKDPSHVTAANNAGIALEFLGDADGARRAYEEGLKHHPGASTLADGLRRLSGQPPGPR